MSGSGGGDTASTSTSTKSLSEEVHRELDVIFHWNPGRLYSARPMLPREGCARTATGTRKATNTRKATGTREPSFYDRHLSDNLILQNVKRLPSLVPDLANNVDRVLRAASATLPRTWNRMTAEQRKDELAERVHVAKDEKAVVEAYLKTTAEFCTPVASTLALHPKDSESKWPKWRNLLVWSTSTHPSGYAIADTQLRVDYDDHSETAHLLNTMDSDTRDIVEKLRDDESSLGTWEFKSIATGSDDVMKAVCTPGKFSWTGCDSKKCSKQKHKIWTKRVRQTVVGPDAENTPWNFNVLDPSAGTTLPTPLTEPSVQPSQRRSNRIKNQAAAAHASTSSAPRAHKVPAATSRVMQKGKQKASPEGGASAWTGGIPKTGTRKRRHNKDNSDGDDGDDSDNDDDDNNDDAFRDKNNLTAQNWVQQAWAQAVQVDGTLIVLHSGNYEIVCVRHRISQTLYVSDVIEPPTCKNPAYGKLQVGIYIAAIQDAIDRKKQEPLQPPSWSPHDGDDGPAGGGGPKDDQRDPDERSSDNGSRGGHGGSSRGGGGQGKTRGGKGNKDFDVDESVVIKAAENRNVLFIYLQYGIYDSPCPSTFIRSAPAITEDKEDRPLLSPRDIASYQAKDSLTVILTSEVGHGATGTVHRGMLDVDGLDGSMPLDVVIKFAFDSEQQAALRDEYETYRLLRSKGVVKGVAAVLGFFDDCERGPSALVMRYAGVSLLEMEPGRVFTLFEREAALNTLCSVHGADIIHGDIRPENILVSNSDITIIDFGHSFRSNDKMAKKKEYKQLLYLLRQP